MKGRRAKVERGKGGGGIKGPVPVWLGSLATPHLCRPVQGGEQKVVARIAAPVALAVTHGRQQC